MATDALTLQTQLNHLSDYCTEWGLSINVKKTNVLIFNKQGRLISLRQPFRLGDTILEQTRSYCYLGITLTPSGSFTTAMDERRKKALRTYFILKRTVDIRFLSPRAILKLYDSLIKPVLTYGCQIWLHATKFVKCMTTNKPHKWTLQQIAQDPCERAHLQFLKWILGVNKKCSNVACWGDTGRFPICLEITNQVLNYKIRLEDIADEHSLVYNAYQEQKDSELSWYSSLTKLERRFLPTSSSTDPKTSRGQAVKLNLQRELVEKWFEGLNGQPKLRFYRELKNTFGFECYLDMKTSEWRRAITRLRSSSHTLNIETGRYKDASNPKLRECLFCLNILGHNIMEDEMHFLASCPLFCSSRSQLPDPLKSILLRQDLSLSELFNSLETSIVLGRYIKGSFAIREEYLKSIKLIK